MYIKPHTPCRKAIHIHSNKQMATENRACLLFGDIILIQCGWTGFLSKIFRVVLDIFPVKEFQQRTNELSQQKWNRFDNEQSGREQIPSIWYVRYHSLNIATLSVAINTFSEVNNLTNNVFGSLITQVQRQREGSRSPFRYKAWAES